MCSVVGYISSQLSCSTVFEGLSRLEYRGYDSSGFACLSPKDNRLLFAKAQGRLSNLQDQLKKHPIDGFAGIGHTRWSTHGSSSSLNAHPHFDCDKALAIVHNGIIENHHQLKQELLKDGHIFHSQTDTEIVAHLLEQSLVKHKALKPAVLETLKHIEGAFAFIVLFQDYPDTLLLVRKRSPLCIGIGDNEMFAASDPLAFAGKTNKVVFLPDHSFALVNKNNFELYNFDGSSLPITIQNVSHDWKGNEKRDHEHFMLKEIYEQKTAIHDTVELLRSIRSHIWDHINVSANEIKRLDKLNIIGCGTSWHAGRIAQFFFESISLLPTRVHLASEFRYMPFFVEDKTMYLLLSQSGETADTLEALRMITALKRPAIAITNVASSTLVRESDGFLLTQHDREIAVASTKAFSTQLTLLYWLAHRIALEKGIISVQQMDQSEEDLLLVAEVLENSIENYKFPIMQKYAKQYAQFKKAIFLGRHISYPFAMEAALKLKEVAYIFSQCYPAGELKHGPLALIDQDIPVFVFSHQDQLLYQKLVSNAQEAKARGGHVVVFAFEGQDELIELADTSFVFPKVKSLLAPLAMSGLMQFFVYSIAKNLGCAIDKPRNLAKSVTVE